MKRVLFLLLIFIYCSLNGQDSNNSSILISDSIVKESIESLIQDYENLLNNITSEKEAMDVKEIFAKNSFSSENVSRLFNNSDVKIEDDSDPSFNPQIEEGSSILNTNVKDYLNTLITVVSTSETDKIELKFIAHSSINKGSDYDYINVLFSSHFTGHISNNAYNSNIRIAEVRIVETKIDRYFYITSIRFFNSPLFISKNELDIPIQKNQFQKTIPVDVFVSVEGLSVKVTSDLGVRLGKDPNGNFYDKIDIKKSDRNRISKIYVKAQRLSNTGKQRKAELEFEDQYGNRLNGNTISLSIFEQKSNINRRKQETIDAPPIDLANSSIIATTPQKFFIDLSSPMSSIKRTYIINFQQSFEGLLVIQCPEGIKVKEEGTDKKPERNLSLNYSKQEIELELEVCRNLACGTYNIVHLLDKSSLDTILVEIFSPDIQVPKIKNQGFNNSVFVDINDCVNGDCIITSSGSIDHWTSGASLVNDSGEILISASKRSADEWIYYSRTSPLTTRGGINIECGNSSKTLNVIYRPKLSISLTAGLNRIFREERMLSQIFNLSIFHKYGGVFLGALTNLNDEIPENYYPLFQINGVIEGVKSTGRDPGSISYERSEANINHFRFGLYGPAIPILKNESFYLFGQETGVNFLPLIGFSTISGEIWEVHTGQLNGLDPHILSENLYFVDKTSVSGTDLLLMGTFILPPFQLDLGYDFLVDNAVLNAGIYWPIK